MTEMKKARDGRLFIILSGIVVLVSLIAGLILYPQLPEQVPSHWNAAGEIDGYMGRLGGAFFLPAVMLGLLIMLTVIPKIDPKKRNYQSMGKVYSLVVFTIIVFMGAIYAGTIAAVYGHPMAVPRIAMPGIGLLLIILGNYMGKIKYNYTFGIRTPWTLASEEVWYKTHRVMGPLWVVGGLILLPVGFLPAGWTMPLIVGVSVLLSLGSMGYSFLVYRKIMKDS
ncbi:SdpI family protein [Desulfosporosinus youngiae]|uniref:Putative integral membrane protein n=1 Tax=Desulfosporosinus youngiae DSM 17734 TaxID=768710 RepID=H5XX07_9FIRM|nr:SdpI family protein [Desulfosporosinus youngiae]EHQ90875.1 putative integral membrane protein [Desulfosporosinus youngiae DSM 17734]